MMKCVFEVFLHFCFNLFLVCIHKKKIKGLFHTVPNQSLHHCRHAMYIFFLKVENLNSKHGNQSIWDNKKFGKTIAQLRTIHAKKMECVKMHFFVIKSPQF